MGFRSPLDIGGFLEHLDRKNDANARCKLCGRDRRLKGTISANTTVLRRCNICNEPLLWSKTGPNGEQEEWEWLVEHQRAVKKKSHGNNIRISID